MSRAGITIGRKGSNRLILNNFEDIHLAHWAFFLVRLT
jgi:hypothetical protein